MAARIFALSLAAVALFPATAAATSASYGTAMVPALAPDGTIRFVERTYYCYNRTDHEDAIPLVLATPIRWEAQDDYCRFSDESYDEDGEIKPSAVLSADHRKRGEVNPFRAAGLRFAVKGYRCPFIFKKRNRGITKFDAALKKAGLDDPQKLVALAVETLEKNLAKTRHVDCGIRYVGFDTALVATGALPTRFNQLLPDACYSPNAKRGDATDCKNPDALLETARTYAGQDHVYGTLAVLDRLHAIDADRAFRAYRDEPELAAMKPRRWSRFHARYERWRSKHKRVP